MNKTNVMRILDRAKIHYEPKEYTPDENDLSGVHIAQQIGLDAARCFKTVVTRADKTGITVFCLPANREIDLKKAAKITGNKKIEPLHVKDLLAVAGYVRGACSPIGMKKKFPTFFDQSCRNFESVTVSAGIKGCQLLVGVEEVLRITDAKTADLTADQSDKTA